MTTLPRVKTRMDDVTEEEKNKAKDLWQRGKTVVEISLELNVSITIADRIRRSSATQRKPQLRSLR